MAQTAGIILCLAYILGVMLGDIEEGKYLLLGGGIILSFFLSIFVKQSLKKRRKRSQDPDRILDELPPIISLITLPKWFWISTGIVGFLASCYFQWRVPSPQFNDISQLITQNRQNQERILTVHGQVDSTPRLTRSKRIQFILQAIHIDEIRGVNEGALVNQPVSGKVYVTVPLLQGTGLYPGAIISITGRLYQPKSAQNPRSFDFKKYLAEQGIFAGFNGEQINWKESKIPPPFSWWNLRQQIVKTQVEGLGVPIGPLVSAISLGKQAVDLPYNIRDIFVLSGLAHLIAASGTQVSFLLGIVTTLGKNLSRKLQFILGVSSLILLLGLTGLEPSIVRASFMGLLTLIAILTQREIKPLSALLLAAVVLLLINPLWIKDLGFQLSFLATLGLIVTVPPVIRYLDWLPPSIALLIAVPIAAFIWVTPRLIAVFGALIPYSIIANIIASPLAMIISLGGLISASFAVISPPLGTGIAQLLYYPTLGLIELATLVSNLPGNQVNVGSISVLQEILLYGLIIVIWILGLWREWSREIIKEKIKKLELEQKTKIKIKNKKEFPLGMIGIILALLILMIPAWTKRLGTLKTTILADQKEAILVIQNKDQVILMNSGDKNTVRYTILPFLVREGINEIFWGIETNTHLGIGSGWEDIIQGFFVKNFADIPTKKAPYLKDQPLFLKLLKDYQISYHHLSNHQPLALGDIQIQMLQGDPLLLKLKIQEKSWLFMGELPQESQKYLLNHDSFEQKHLKNIDTICWNGSQLEPEFLDIINPKVAIIFGNKIHPRTREILEKKKTLIYITEKDGAITWSPSQGFQSALESTESPLSSP